LNDNVYSVGADFQCAGAQIVRILAAEALNNSNGALANAATLQSQIEEQALTAMSDINLKKMSAADIACTSALSACCRLHSRSLAQASEFCFVSERNLDLIKRRNNLAGSGVVRPAVVAVTQIEGIIVQPAV